MNPLARMGSRHRRGDANGFLVAAIIAIVCFIIILLWAVKNGLTLNADFNTNLCRMELLAQSGFQGRITISGITLDSPLSTDCKRRYMDITPTRVVDDPPGTLSPSTPINVYRPVDGKGLVPLPTYKTLDESVLASTLAESMRRCWQIGLEGKYQVMNDQSIFAKKNVCIICDEISVQSDSPGPLTKGTWLSNYLIDTTMPGDSAKRTYENYLFTDTPLQQSWNLWANPITGGPGGSADGLSLSGGPACIVERGIDENPQIQDGEYATIFFRDFSKFQTGCMGTYVVPAAQVRYVCDYVAN